HSSSRQLANVPRNLGDAQLAAVGRNGGAVCVNFYPGFLDRRTYDSVKKAEADLKERGTDVHKLTIAESRRALAPLVVNHADVATLADHIEHIAKVAGIDHVCLGSDFDGIPFLPRGLYDVSQLPLITEELQRRGM